MESGETAMSLIGSVHTHPTKRPTNLDSCATSDEPTVHRMFG